MPLRKSLIITGEIYHVLNRGVAEAPIFYTDSNYKRFLELLEYYRFVNSPLSFSKYKKLNKEEKVLLKEKLNKEGIPQVEIYSFCLIPNHFHTLLKQLRDNGIRQMLSNVQISYSKYINTKTSRAGPLFQSRFKAIRIATDDIFLHVSRYIHLNPATSYLVKREDLKYYPWSSLPYYLGLENQDFVNKDMALKIIGGAEDYKNFVFNQLDYQRKLNKIRHLMLEK
jgi:putative transposase